VSQRSGPRIRLATEDDLAEVCKIVNHFIETTVFNFRTEPQGIDEWRNNGRRLHARFPWLVATDDRVVGLA
jgi:phosphinothricin acetyltransferase